MPRLLEGKQRSSTDRNVVVVARHSLQNGLLVELLDRHLGCTCRVTPIDRVGDAVTPHSVALLDVGGMSNRDIGACVQALHTRGLYLSIALLNADRTSVLEIVASPGIQGVFYSDISKEQLVKGIEAVFSGEYWLPRSVLAAHFEKYRPKRAAAVVTAIGPTRKEAETLRLLVDGNSNAAIARHLGVSPHTVKTHLYNLFRKLGVKNRVQAVNWAKQNAQGMEGELG